MDNFVFTPAQGFKDASSYPNPSSEAETREQLMSLHEQTRDFINANLVDAVTSDTVVKIKANAAGFSYSTDGTNYTVIEGSSSGQGDMYTSVYDTDADGIVDNAELVNGHTVEADVPANAVFTDTVYDDTAVLASIDSLENHFGAYTQIATDISPNGGTVTLTSNYSEYLFIINGQFSSSNKLTATKIIPFEVIKLLVGKPHVNLYNYTASGGSDSVMRVHFEVTESNGSYPVVFGRTQTNYAINSIEVYGR